MLARAKHEAQDSTYAHPAAQVEPSFYATAGTLVAAA